MEDIDEAIVDLLSLGSFARGYIWIWTLHLKIWTHIWCPCALHLVHVIWQLWEVYLTAYLGTSSENMNSLQNLLFHHRGLFYKRPARTITGQQQQHEMVTTTTTTHSDLHKLLSVQELIFPIHLWNMNTSSEKLMLICTHHFIIRGVYLSTSSDKLT